MSYFLNKTGSLRAPKDEADSPGGCITALMSKKRFFKTIN